MRFHLGHGEIRNPYGADSLRQFLHPPTVLIGADVARNEQFADPLHAQTRAQIRTTKRRELSQRNYIPFSSALLLFVFIAQYPQRVCTHTHARARVHVCTDVHV